MFQAEIKFKKIKLQQLFKNIGADISQGNNSK